MREDGHVWAAGRGPRRQPAIDEPYGALVRTRVSEYLVQQMQMYASGQRRSDVYGRMRTITPAEIHGVARHYRQGFQ